MFSKKQKEQPQPESALTGVDIYTIPEKFYLPNLKSGGAKNRWVGILIMILAFLAIVIGGYFFVVKIIF